MNLDKFAFQHKYMILCIRKLLRVDLAYLNNLSNVHNEKFVYENNIM